jgi:hypothetical protein
MDGNGPANESGREEAHPPVIASRPWYRRKWVWIAGIVLILTGLAVLAVLKVRQEIQPA